MERLTNKREADAQREEYERHLANGYPRDIHSKHPRGGGKSIGGDEQWLNTY